MNRISHLAWRGPVALGLVALVSGCYTMFSHPESQMVASDEAYSDCASCHAAGFASPLVPDPYTYTSIPFQDFYGSPWWMPGMPSTYAGGSVGGGGSKKSISRDDEDTRHTGGRGAPAPPTYNPPGTNAQETPSRNSGTQTQTTSPGQQPGRTMKKDASKDSKSGSAGSGSSSSQDKKDEPKDDSGG